MIREIFFREIPSFWTICRMLNRSTSSPLT
jgi:hypothetical protein